VSIKKIWLTEFHRWVMGNCNSTTQETMDDILKTESDWETLQIIYNSLAKVEGGQGKKNFSNYFNNLGHLYPGKSGFLQEAKDYREFMHQLEHSPYHNYFTKIPEPANASEESELDIDDCQK